MSVENIPEKNRETRYITFFFPNEHPEEDVVITMQKIIDYSFEGGIMDLDKITEMGTIWFAEVSVLGEKPRKVRSEMTEEELELDLLREEHMPDEF